jgi:hypothetical protein
MRAGVDPEGFAEVGVAVEVSVPGDGVEEALGVRSEALSAHPDTGAFTLGERVGGGDVVCGAVEGEDPSGGSLSGFRDGS